MSKAQSPFTSDTKSDSNTSSPSSSQTLTSYTCLALICGLFLCYHLILTPLASSMREHIANKKGQELVESTEAERKQRDHHALIAGATSPSPARSQPPSKSASRKSKSLGPVPSTPTSKEARGDAVPSSLADPNDNKPSSRSVRSKKTRKKPNMHPNSSEKSKTSTPASSDPQITSATQAYPDSIRSCGVQAAASVSRHCVQTPSVDVPAAASTSSSDIEPEDAIDADDEDHHPSSSVRNSNPYHRRDNTLTRSNMAGLDWSGHKRQQSNASSHAPQTVKQQQQNAQTRPLQNGESSDNSSCSTHSCGDRSSVPGVISPNSAATSLSSSAVQSAQMQSFQQFKTSENLESSKNGMLECPSPLPWQVSRHAERHVFAGSLLHKTAASHQQKQQQNNNPTTTTTSRQRSRSATSPSAYRTFPHLQPLPVSNANSSPHSTQQQHYTKPDLASAPSREVPSTPGQWSSRQVYMTPQNSQTRNRFYQSQQLPSPTLNLSRSRSQAASPSVQQQHQQHNVPASPITFLQSQRGSQDLGTFVNGTQTQSLNPRITELAASESILAYNQMLNAELLRRQQQQQQLLTMSIAQQQAQNMLNMTDHVRVTTPNTFLFNAGAAYDPAQSNNLPQSPAQDPEKSPLPALTVSDSLNGSPQGLQSAQFSSSWNDASLVSPIQQHFTTFQQGYTLPVTQPSQLAPHMLASSTSSSSRPMSRSNSLCSARSTSPSYWPGHKGLDASNTAFQGNSRGPSPSPSFGRTSDESSALLERVSVLEEKLRDTEIESVRRRKEVEWAEFELQQVQAEAAQTAREKDEKIRELEREVHKQALLLQEEQGHSRSDWHPSSEPEQLNVGRTPSKVLYFQFWYLPSVGAEFIA